MGIFNKAYGCDFSTNAYRKMVLVYETYMLTKYIYNNTVNTHIYEQRQLKLKKNQNMYKEFPEVYQKLGMKYYN